MSSFTRTILSTAMSLVLLAHAGLAHGGKYIPGSDMGAPDRGGGAAAPPTNPSGAMGAPGLGNSSTTGGVGSSTGRGHDPRQGGRNVASTTGQHFGLDAGYASWEFWWEANQDQFLDLKGRLDNGSFTGSSTHLTNMGRRMPTRGSRRPDESVVRDVVLPALLALATQSDERDVVDSAILAAARVARPQDAAAVLDVATRLLAHHELSVQTSAALSLGVLADRRATPALQALVGDTRQGRLLTGGGTVPWLTRAFAALSLGLVDDPEGVTTLIDVVRATPDADRDIKACAIVGLGLMTNNEADRAVPFLVEQLADRKLDAIIKSFIPTSIAKLSISRGGATAPARSALLNAFAHRDTDDFVLQSCAIALGQVASPDDENIVSAIIDYVREGRNEQTRHFCLIALAEIAGRQPITSSRPEAIHLVLTRQISKPDPKTHRPWAALAGALYARSVPEAQTEVIERIRAVYADEANPANRAAYALALGLLGDRTSAPTLHEDYRETGDQHAKGYFALALGFLDHSSVAEELHAVCRDRTVTPTYRLQVATALGLLRDTQGVDVLVGALRDSSTLGVSSAVARAIGLIGDRTAVSPLRDTAIDGDMPATTRGFACVALGLVAERTTLPWNSRISAHNNYRASVPAMQEVLDIR